MSPESTRDQAARSSSDAAMEPAAEPPTKSVLGGTAAVLAVAAVWAGSVRPTALPADVYHQRLTRIEAMSLQERQQLKQNFEAFGELSPAAHDELRELDRAVAADDGGDELLAVMTRYDAWLDELPYDERYTLQDLDVDARLEQIAGRRVREYHLPRQDVRIIAVWLKERIATRGGRDGGGRDQPPLDRRLRMLNEAISRFERSVSKGQTSDEKVNETIVQLISDLSDATRAQLKMAGDESQQRRALADWLRRIETRRPTLRRNRARDHS